MIGFAMLTSFILAAVLGPSIMVLASTFGIVDEPDGKRKIHREPIPLLGGIAVFVPMLVVTVFFLLAGDRLTFGEVSSWHYVGFLAGGLVLMLGGWLDDQFTLSAKVTIWFPVVAALLAIAGGIEVSKLSNPIGGGVIEVQSWFSDVLVFLWLLVMMYTTKLLDGLDGVVSGVTVVGAFAVTMLSLTAAFLQLDVALFSSIGLGAFLGFMVWNWHPAKIFLGEGGSTFAGYFLGVLAVISGGKVAIALLALGVPLIDLCWTILRRLKNRKGITTADRSHLHHRLLDLGWKQSSVAIFYITAAFVFGFGALFLQSREKLFALILLVMLVVALGTFVVRKEKRL